MSEVSARELVTITGARVRVPDPDHLIHVQFRRFAGCPICNLHLRSVVQRLDEIVAAGIREVVFFHSPAAELREYGLPFAVVADPDKRYYREFGVESGRRAVLDPRAWGAILRGSALTLAGAFRPPAARPEGGRLGLPADFLIARSGRVLASKLGTHAYDQWSVDELLTHARTAALR
jgi:peroxiredoxin